MARNTDPVCKMCRREGVKLFLKGSRCFSPKCSIERRNTAPGMHGHRKSKSSEYAERLRAKQRLKRFYGVFERQFRRYFALASKSTENTGEVLLQIMERRLDNVVYRLGFASSRAAARQLVLHGHISINGKLCNIPSILVNRDETITLIVRERSRRKGSAGGEGEGSKRHRNAPALVRQVLQERTEDPPSWLQRVSVDPPEGKVLAMPARSDVDPNIKDAIDEQLIIEFCSR